MNTIKNYWIRTTRRRRSHGRPARRRGGNLTKKKHIWTSIKREDFLPKELKSKANQDRPLSIGFRQTTSQPSLIIRMLRLLDIPENCTKKCNVLDVGSGSGIVTAAMSCIMGRKSYVLGIDVYSKIVSQSIKNVNKHRKDNNCKGRVNLLTRNIFTLNNKNKYTHFFDRIYVGADPKHEQNEFKRKIVKLLKPNGKCIAPIGGKLFLYKNNYWHDLKMPVRFVPLVTRYTEHVGQQCYNTETQFWEKGRQPKGSCNTKKICFAKNKNYCNKKKYCKGIMWSKQWKDGKQVKWCSSTSLTKNPNWISIIKNNPEDYPTPAEQKKMINDDKKLRDSGMCKKKRKDACEIPTITGRSNDMYLKHLFPDKKRIKKKSIIIDVGCGLNPYNQNSFIVHNDHRHIIRCLDIYKPNDIFGIRPNLLKYGKYIKGGAHNTNYKKLKINKKADIILIHNYFYLWLDNPKKLQNAYKNILKWTKKGSQIRIFPVYFGRYDSYNDTLKEWIDRKFKVQVMMPQHSYERVPMWSAKYKKIVHVNKEDNKYEQESNRKMKAMTLILTVK